MISSVTVKAMCNILNQMFSILPIILELLTLQDTQSMRQVLTPQCRFSCASDGKMSLNRFPVLIVHCSRSLRFAASFLSQDEQVGEDLQFGDPLVL